MDDETQKLIEETVLEILNNSSMDETTEFKIRKTASEKLGIDLSEPNRKKFVREVVESYLREQLAKTEQLEGQQEGEAEAEEEEEEEEGGSSKTRGDREYDDEGGLIICRLSKNRRVTISEFRGRKLVSIREYYSKGDKELPSTKGISLTAEQWASFKKNVPAIEKAIKKMECM
ncbi:RNA polymerase II transcriptional coactivator KELP [Dorcoceras hygrometricum]|uniref:RNA polymerase II transcriptional coactivator KELP n=1 Tax=Dorcoceras hygrometricum TaxID=472368 RepID=A0A2Z7BAG8_9LAMI|nr:RNA polymerase II transcriptional coactivator KELP [Dorcoceras hygrometricum]